MLNFASPRAAYFWNSSGVTSGERPSPPAMRSPARISRYQRPRRSRGSRGLKATDSLDPLVPVRGQCLFEGVVKGVQDQGHRHDDGGLRDRILSRLLEGVRERLRLLRAEEATGGGSDV